jgi:hypothetical protein
LTPGGIFPYEYRTLTPPSPSSTKRANDEIDWFAIIRNDTIFGYVEEALVWYWVPVYCWLVLDFLTAIGAESYLDALVVASEIECFAVISEID